MTSQAAQHIEEEAFDLPDEALLTPALLISKPLVRHNIRCMARLLAGNLSRWRPHLKTVKLPAIMRLLVDEGVATAKCSTSLELLWACRSGFADVLVAYPHVGENARRIAAIAHQFPQVGVSCLIESPEQIHIWRGSRVGLYIDVNSGMNRTGAESSPETLTMLASNIKAAGLAFRGLHFYDGHSTEPDREERAARARSRYDELLGIIDQLEQQGQIVEELITSGTPALVATEHYAGFTGGKFKHQVSPGTVVYNDLTSLSQLDEKYGFQAAACVLSRVVSHPKIGTITCDAGHKAVSVDSGVPNCLVLNHEGLVAAKPSEEHLPLEVTAGFATPFIGELLHLLPRHICPTVNNFDFALVKDADAVEVASVNARGHEGPMALNMPTAPSFQQAVRA